MGDMPAASFSVCFDGGNLFIYENIQTCFLAVDEFCARGKPIGMRRTSFVEAKWEIQVFGSVGKYWRAIYLG